MPGYEPFLLCDFHVHTRWSDGAPDASARSSICTADRPVRRDRDHRSHPDEARSAGARGAHRDARPPRVRRAARSGSTPTSRTSAREAERAMADVRHARRSRRRDHAEPPRGRKNSHIIALDIKQVHQRRSAAPTTSCARSAVRARSASPAIRITGRRGGSRSARATCGTIARRSSDLVDVWEAANRDDLFSVTSLKHYPYVANSDFHKPKHLYSWKTLVRSEKNWPAIRSRCGATWTSR